MALLLYGAGLRLLECCRLRVKDVDFATNQIVIRDGKGRKDRVTMLPAAVKTLLMTQIDHVRAQHQADLRRGAGWVELPGALLRKYPNAGREWGWQWVFPATRFYVDRLTGQRRRHHLHESVLQRAVKDAVRAVGDGYRPRVVFSSSIAVFGPPFADVIGDEQALTPATSFSAHSASSVNNEMFPPTRDCSAPPMVPTMLRDRTVMPRTRPMTRTTR